MSHECDKCGRVFKYKSKILEHKNRKTPCKPAQNVPPNAQNVPPNANKSCAICGKEFTRISNKERHELTCKGHDSMTCKYCEKSFASHKGRWKHENDRPNSCYKIENIKLKANVDTVNPVGTVNITINTINNTINMIPYDQEKYENIDCDVVKELHDDYKDINKIIGGLVKKGHENNQNAKITNLRSNIAFVFDGNKFIPISQLDVILTSMLKLKDRMLELPIREKDLVIPRTIDTWMDDESCDENPDFIRDRRLAMDAVKLALYTKS